MILSESLVWFLGQEDPSPSEGQKDPNEAVLITDIAFLVSLILLATIDIVIYIKCRVYKNFTQNFIMLTITAITIVRIYDFGRSIIDYQEWFY